MPKSSEQTHIAIKDIVGLSEIADRLDTTARAVWNWPRRYAATFPKPIARISNTPLWDWNEVKEWYDNWEPSKGGWHTHKSQREVERRPRRARRQFMEGDDDSGTRKPRARKTA